MDRETETLLILASRTLRFATAHPYFATGVLGAVAGSAATYKVLEFNAKRSGLKNIFTPKIYELELSNPDLQHLLETPGTELRWETPEATVVIVSEKREPLKELPVIEHDDEDESGK